MELSVRHLTKQYRQKLALNDVSFTLQPGIYGLLGPNGAGKTTLVQIVAGILQKTSGSVLWNGAGIETLGPRYREILGFAPQMPGLYKTFRANEFLRYMAAVKGLTLTPRELDRTVGRLLDTVNLRSDAKRRIGEFSGGMRQRLCIAQALLGDPKLLLLDEPTAGLDPQERIRLRNAISAAAVDKIILWTTHIVTDIASTAREVLLLREGQLLTKDAPRALTAGMQGRVYTVAVPPGDLPRWQRETLVGNVLVREGDVLLRVIADHCPGGSPEQPGLEDVYLYHFGQTAEEG